MGRTTDFLKTAGAAIATLTALSAALRENPQIGAQFSKAAERVRGATSSRSPKHRLDAKLDAVIACADAVDEAFADNTETAQWRRRTKNLRMRSELVATGTRGRERRSKFKELDEEAARLLTTVQERLVAMSNGQSETDDEPEAPAVEAN